MHLPSIIKDILDCFKHSMW